MSIVYVIVLIIIGGMALSLLGLGFGLIYYKITDYLEYKYSEKKYSIVDYPNGNMIKVTSSQFKKLIRRKLIERDHFHGVYVSHDLNMVIRYINSLNDEYFF